MKIHYPLFLVSFILLFSCAKAQTENWQGLYLGSPDGTNSFNGVEAYYTISTCNNNDVILIRLTNHNAYAVKAGWQDFVMSKDNKKLDRATVQDSVTIQPQSVVAGECAGNSVQLVIKLTDFGILKEDFKEFRNLLVLLQAELNCQRILLQQ